MWNYDFPFVNAITPGIAIERFSIKALLINGIYPQVMMEKFSTTS